MSNRAKDSTFKRKYSLDKYHLSTTRSLTHAGSALASDGFWRSKYEANVLEETRSGRADGCGRMVWRLYCVNADAHGLNSESESN